MILVWTWRQEQAQDLPIEFMGVERDFTTGDTLAPDRSQSPGRQHFLVVKFDGRTIGIAILDKEQLLLFRTLENMHGAAMSGEQLAEEIYPSVVFFQDTYHLNIERICVAGMPDAAGVAALQAQTGIEVQELVQAGQLVGGANLPVPSSMMAGVLGALIS